MAGEASMSNKLELFLFQIQDTFGSGVGTLDAADYADVEEGGSIENELAMDVVTSSYNQFGQPAQVPGEMPATVSLPYVMRSSGDDSPGYWAAPLQCSGFKETSSTKVYDYDPTYVRTEWKDGTLWHYTGDLSASGALLEKAHNLMFDFEMTLMPGKVGRVVYSGRGAHVGAATDATQPTVSRNAQNAVAVLGSTVSIMGYGYKFLEVKITGNHEVDTTKDPSATYGIGRTLPSDMKIGWTAKLYAVTVAEADAFSQLLAGTQAAFSIAWGTAPNAFTVSSPNSKAQIISRKKSEENGITTLDLEGIFVDNDFNVEVDTTP